MVRKTPKAIETDSDTALQEKSERVSVDDPVHLDLEITETPFTIFEYLRKYSIGKLIIQPDFQRKLVWNNEKKSKFIESIFLNYPIPPIYLNEDIESRYIVIDGLQRTTTLLEFNHGQFALSDLETLPQFNGLMFDDLPDILKSRFEDKKLATCILRPSTPTHVIYDLFNRINTGGTQLNRQEVRNCIFSGKATKLLKDLSEQKFFKVAIDHGIKDTRMKDRETVLRYIAFRWFNYQETYREMSDFLEYVMQKLNKYDDTQIRLIERDFEKVMKWSYEIWGDFNFRIPSENSRGAINIAVLETVCNFISTKSNSFLKRNKQKIKRNYLGLIQNQTYYDAVTRSTGTKSRVENRFRLAKLLLNKGTA